QRRRLAADVRAGVGVVGSAVDGDEYGGSGRLGEGRIIGAVDEPGMIACGEKDEGHNTILPVRAESVIWHSIEQCSIMTTWIAIKHSPSACSPAIRPPPPMPARSCRRPTRTSSTLSPLPPG